MADTKIELEGLDLNSYPDDSDGFTSPPPVYGLMNEEDDIADTQDSSKMKEESHDGGGSRSWLPFLSVEYYQSYFDVTTSDVFHRVVAGMLPLPYNLVSVISKSPDLYGPFWLCMTLIFTISISGNLSALFSGDTQWEFHFHEVVVIATVIYSYTWCLPIILWIFLIWRNSSDRYSLVMLQSIYGYSMGVFIPLTLLWVINLEALRWLLLVFAIILSGAVLVQSLWKPLHNETKQVAMVILGCVLILHSGIAIGFKFYYFGSSLAPDVPVINRLPPATPNPLFNDITHPSTVPPEIEGLGKIVASENRVNNAGDEGVNKGVVPAVNESRAKAGLVGMNGGSIKDYKGTVTDPISVTSDYARGLINDKAEGDSSRQRRSRNEVAGALKTQRDNEAIDSNSNHKEVGRDKTTQGSPRIPVTSSSNTVSKDENEAIQPTRESVDSTKLSPKH